MMQHCLSCDRPIHLRGGDTSTFCADCQESQEREATYVEQRGFSQTLPSRDLPRSESRDLDHNKEGT